MASNECKVAQEHDFFLELGYEGIGKDILAHRSRSQKRAGELATYLTDVLDRLNSTVDTLKGKYNDGRFLETIEDLVLAVSFKRDMQCDHVVGKPP